MTRDELLEYFKSERTRFEKTRDIQWKFNIALWTLLALAISFLKKPLVEHCYSLIWLAMFLFLFAHLLFVWLIQKGLIASKMMSHKILDALNKQHPENGKDEIYFNDRRIEKLKWRWGDIWWIIFQVLTSLILILVLYVKLTSGE